MVSNSINRILHEKTQEIHKKVHICVEKMPPNHFEVKRKYVILVNVKYLAHTVNWAHYIILNNDKNRLILLSSGHHNYVIRRALLIRHIM